MKTQTVEKMVVGSINNAATSVVSRLSVQIVHQHEASTNREHKTLVPNGICRETIEASINT